MLTLNCHFFHSQKIEKKQVVYICVYRDAIYNYRSYKIYMYMNDEQIKANLNHPPKLYIK